MMLALCLICAHTWCPAVVDGMRRRQLRRRWDQTVPDSGFQISTAVGFLH
jgi:hypothetical protein